MARLRKQTKYTTIANETCINPDLSLKAKGFLVLLLSFPDDWEFNFDYLVQCSADGRESTRTAMRELTEKGYLEKQPIQNEKGVFDGWDWFVSDVSPSHIVGKPVLRETRRTVPTEDGTIYITKKNIQRRSNNNTNTDPLSIDLVKEKKEIKEKKESWLDRALGIYLELALPNWVKHSRLTDRAKGQLKKFEEFFGDESANKFKQALTYASSQDFYQKNNLSIEMIGSNDKFITFAECASNLNRPQTHQFADDELLTHPNYGYEPFPFKASRVKAGGYLPPFGLMLLPLSELRRANEN